MRGKGCLSQMLKALAAYLSSRYCLIIGRFSGVGGQGSTGGVLGGADLIGQEQGLSSGPRTPELEHLPGAEMAAAMAGLGSGPGEHDPTDGKSAGIIPKSIQAALDR